MNNKEPRPNNLLKLARNEGTYRKILSKYSNPFLLIIDEWLLLKPAENERKDIFELLSKRRKKSSTIFCTQYKSEGWYEQLGGSAAQEYSHYEQMESKANGRQEIYREKSAIL